jgi:hypothetical protein
MVTIRYRSRSPMVIPLADASALASSARRTTVVRLLLALVVVGLLAGAVLSARDAGARPSTYFDAAGAGVIVVDLSTSIDESRYRRLARVLRTLVETSQPIGLVIHSDDAYEALPLGTSGDVLRPMLRFFEAPLAASRLAGFTFPENPWATSFRGGTRISAGLSVARQALEREGVAGGSVLLISDLDDSPFDTATLTEEAVRYRRARIDLRLVSLRPAQPDRELFTRLLGREAFVPHKELLANTTLEERHSLAGSFPFLLVLLAAALLGAVALNEHLCGRLRWSAAPAARPSSARSPEVFGLGAGTDDERPRRRAA